jgi:hypothetical protein
VTCVFPNGKAEMLLVEGPGKRPALDQLMDLAAVCPPGEWSAVPVEGTRLPL